MTEFNLSEKILGYNPDTQERLLFTRDVREAIRLVKDIVDIREWKAINKIFGPELTQTSDEKTCANLTCNKCGKKTQCLCKCGLCVECNEGAKD